MCKTLNIYFNNVDFTKDADYKFITENILLGKEDKEYFACVKLEGIDAEDEIPNLINSTISSIQKQKKEKNFFRGEVILNILIHHDIIKDIDSGCFWCLSCNMKEGKFQIGNCNMPLQTIRENLPNKFRDIENICKKHCKSVIKIINPNTNFIYHVIIISNKFAHSDDWQSENIDDKWGFESCSEDSHAINELFSRAKTLNKKIIIFYHGALKESLINKKIADASIRKQIIFIDSFHHVENDKKYESIKNKDLDKLFTIIIGKYKYQIISLWLPLAIDIQGLSEVQHDNGKANSYLDKIREEKKKEKNTFSALLKEHDDIINDFDKLKDIIPDKSKLVKFLKDLDDVKKVKDLKDIYLNPHIKNTFFLPEWLRDIVNKFDNIKSV